MSLSLAIIVLAPIACKGINSVAQSNANSSVLSATPSSSSNNTDIAPIAATQNSYADVVSRVAPAVVTIRSERIARAPQMPPFFDDPRLRDLFGDRLPGMQNAPQRRLRPERFVGSGVIVSSDGYILTNHHVVDGAEQIKVELNDRRMFDAKLIGSDPPSDLAVLKIDATNLPVLPLGDSDKVRVGDVVLAIGNPLGIGQTVTSGIISAKGRTTPDLSDGNFEDFLQTDAPINQGNSGGALVNTNGELVGINSQILSPSGGSIGIGFAIPTSMARAVMDQLIKTGKVRRGQLGIFVQPVTSDIAASLNLKETRGVIVNQVNPGSAAERAGVQQGDIITALNGTPIVDDNDLRNRVAKTPPGTEVALTVLRGGQEQSLRATLGELTVARNSGNRTDASASDAGSEATTAKGKLGIGVQPVTPELARELQLGDNARGLIIGDVDPTGPAADAGLQEGDMIIMADGQNVRSVADLTGAIARAGDRPVLLLVNRRGTTVYVPVRPRR